MMTKVRAFMHNKGFNKTKVLNGAVAQSSAAELASELTAKRPSESSHLNEEETRQILTPFAFKIDQSLFGVSLATPSRRLMALLLDLLFIVLLSDTSGEFLALALAITLYRIGRNRTPSAENNAEKKKGRKRRAILNFMAAFIVFLILLNVLPPLISTLEGNDESKDQIEEQDVDFEQVVIVSTSVIKVINQVGDSQCVTLICWENELTPTITDIAVDFNHSDLRLADETLTENFTDISKETKLSSVEQTQLTDYLVALYKKTMAEIVPLNENSTEQTTLDENKPSMTIQHEQENILNNDAKAESKEPDNDIPENKVSDNSSADSIVAKSLTPIDTALKKEKPTYSMLEWLKALGEDLGLGFGWSTLYFTVFISFWHGQTPGKKILGIKVLQLDGTPLSLWDSFGRYGGYGAGIATGLLGFLQIYWDPNRQAIHDKIASTVVINIRK